MPDSEMKDDCPVDMQHSPISTEDGEQEDASHDMLEDVSSANGRDSSSRHRTPNRDSGVEVNDVNNNLVEHKTINRLSSDQQAIEKARKPNDQELDDLEAEQELMQARRMTLEKAQADLMASFGMNFPMLSGLPYLPATAARNPFLPSAAALNAQKQSVAAADLLRLSSLVYHQQQQLQASSNNHNNDNNSGLGLSMNHAQNGLVTGFDAMERRQRQRQPPASAVAADESPEPEDLSMRSPPASASALAAAMDLGGGHRRLATTASLTSIVDGDGASLADESSLAAATPPLNGVGGGSSSSATQQQQQNWSFEEQFKQLYDLGTDHKRKEFLDDLFSYMQKRGTPVTRIPIMAKQVLDLYELYKLVVSHGGLVEVINKKLWREITKGLNLPSSITSAAFTLRTQYMKYLYPYECEKEKLSSPSELQSAIDGNRREGRRSGGGPGYHPYSQISPTLLGSSRHHVNGVSASGGGLITDDALLASTASMTPQQQAFAQAYREQALALEAAQRHFELSQSGNHRRQASGASDGDSRSCSRESMSRDGNDPLMTLSSPSSSAALQTASSSATATAADGRATTAAAAATAAYAAAFGVGAGSRRSLSNGHRQDGGSHSTTSAAHLSSLAGVAAKLTHRRALGGGNGDEIVKDADFDDDGDTATHRSALPPALLSNKSSSLLSSATAASLLLPTAHIKVTGRGDGQAKVDSSLVVSMEINGIMYQGVLFAQPRA